MAAMSRPTRDTNFLALIHPWLRFATVESVRLAPSPGRDATPQPGDAPRRRTRRPEDQFADDHGRVIGRRRAYGSRTPRRPHRLIRLLLLAVLASSLTGLAPVPVASGDELADARAQQQALAARIAAQRKQVARLTVLQADLRDDATATKTALVQINADLGTVRSRIATLTKRIATVTAAYEGLVAELADLDDRLATIEIQEARKSKELSKRKAILADRLRAAYDRDRTSPLETFLSAGSFVDVLSEVGSYIDFAEQDRKLGEQIARDQETLAALHQSVSDTRAASEALRQETARQRDELADRVADLKASRDQLKALESETASRLAEQQAGFAKLAKSKAAVTKAIAEEQASQRAVTRKVDGLLRARAGRGGIPSVFNGTFEWPLSGVITQPFGCTGFAWEPPLGNCANFHRGIDIATAKYTPIRAAGDGTVLFAGPNPYDRNPKAWIVIIAHARNLLTWYAHVDDRVKPPIVRAGQFVRQGQVIAYEGSTGRSTGPHLDWRVQYNGKFVNPRLFVR